MNNNIRKLLKKETKNQKIGWEVGCCGIIRCWECKRIVNCAKLNITTCIGCMKDCCDYCFENVHGKAGSRSQLHETLTAEQVGQDIDQVRISWELQRFNLTNHE